MTSNNATGGNAGPVRPDAPSDDPPSDNARARGAARGSGVPGLDGILGGGLPHPMLYVLKGAPGTGKTTFGLQFLLEGVRRGEPVVYVSLSQTRAELEFIARSHGWSLDGVTIEELDGDETLGGALDQTIFQSADLRLDRTRQAIETTLRRVRPTRIVYDSLLEVRQLSGDPVRFRRELLAFKSFLAANNITALLIDLSLEFGGDAEIEGLAHGIFCFEKLLPEYGVARRRLEVKKMRGVPYEDGYHDMAIRRGEGLVVFPRVLPRLAPEAPREDPVRSDIAPLDAMLGGGLEAGTTTLLVGQAGTGKSTIGSVYALAALRRGENVGMFLFEERIETFFRRSEGLGLDLRPYAKNGQLTIWDFNPAEISPGQFGNIVQDAVEQHNMRVVLIDSVTGYLGTLPRSDQAVMQIHALVKYLSRRGVLSMLVVAQHGLLGRGGGHELDVSFLGDAVILLRMFERSGRIGRTLTVVKKRHGPHDLDVRELVIRPGGLEVRPHGEAGT